MLEDYKWIVVCGGLAMALMGFGIGANDVANNFGSSVGSRAIQLRYAICIAGVMEFVGAVVFGSRVTNTVRKGVLNFNDEDPGILMFGNLCALISASLCLLLATRIGTPVSTTHSIIGALVGFGLATGRPGVISWPFVGKLVASWICSPILAAMAGALIFIVFRHFILRASEPVRRAYRYLWILVFLLSVCFSFFFMYSNPMYLRHVSCYISDEIQNMQPCSVSLWVENHPLAAVGLSFGLSVCSSFVLIPLSYWRATLCLRKFDTAQRDEASTTISHSESFEGGEEELTAVALTPPTVRTPSTPNNKCTFPQTRLSYEMRRRWDDWSWKFPWNRDLHQEVFATCGATEMVHSRAEVFDERAEAFFAFLQIISAMTSCLVHGANDVANASGPFASIYDIFKSETFTPTVSVPIWILAVGGGSIAVGLAIYGDKVIQTIGVRLVKITPSRGFAIELGMVVTMLIGSHLGIPLSSTQCQVGSTTGVGLIDRGRTTGEEPIKPRWLGGVFNLSAVNGKLVLRIFGSWVSSFVLSGLVSATLFSFAVYAPTLSSYYSRVTP